MPAHHDSDRQSNQEQQQNNSETNGFSNSAQIFLDALILEHIDTEAGFPLHCRRLVGRSGNLTTTMEVLLELVVTPTMPTPMQMPANATANANANASTNADSNTTLHSCMQQATKCAWVTVFVFVQANRAGIETSRNEILQ